MTFIIYYICNISKYLPAFIIYPTISEHTTKNWATDMIAYQSDHYKVYASIRLRLPVCAPHTLMDSEIAQNKKYFDEHLKINT